MVYIEESKEILQSNDDPTIRTECVKSKSR